MEPRNRNVCFTINATDGIPLLLLDPSHSSWMHVKFLVYQREFGSHEHFQGYVEFTQPKSFTAIHLLEGMEHASLFSRHGSAKQAAHYCMKPVEGCQCQHCCEEASSPTKLEGPWTFGEMSSQGQRADLLEVKRRIDDGSSLKRLWRDTDTFPTMIKFHRGFETYKRLTTLPRDFKPKVILFCGRSGMGKTSAAYAIAQRLGSVYSWPNKPGGNFWCDDYGGEDVFFLDEMNGDKMTPEFFNAFVDRYPFVVPAHGSAGHQLVSPYIFICSNYAPKFWWKKRNADQVHQTMRRIDVVFKFLLPPPLLQPCPHCAKNQRGFFCPFHHL
ncbi:replication-associated protein [McMurdo Ice Shelf pond-associated circular DNA virus-6]|uniref:replication-associated protein n=1 Tax=McMurdo Ice Shelf pond-associated circular DNA virus-6 TaxID=1521390 RepID=UPI0004D1C199|nr:replication-associated protein [McMurdo Ice Shelf pond-associated circular DNA virus-6]AIF71514.1 replication-associated protein [McMurdo Ice Shelf pond-associated circular DNA virus-6]